jgi:hypothetical protein
MAAWRHRQVDLAPAQHLRNTRATLARRLCNACLAQAQRLFGACATLARRLAKY